MISVATAMQFAQFAPKIIGWLSGSDKAEDVAGKVVEVARAVTGEQDPDMAWARISQSEELALSFRQKIMENELEFQKLAIGNADSINKTMQAEAGSEHWPTWSWRPFIGFVFGVNILITTVVVAVVYISAMLGEPSALTALKELPEMISAMALVNGAALPVLGVASWFRGKMQADPAIPQPEKLPFKKPKA